MLRCAILRSSCHFFFAFFVSNDTFALGVVASPLEPALGSFEILGRASPLESHTSEKRAKGKRNERRPPRPHYLPFVFT